MSEPRVTEADLADYEDKRDAFLGEKRWGFEISMDEYCDLLHDLRLYRPVGECAGAHVTGPMLWPGTMHQGAVCRRCKRFLPC